MSCIEGFQVIYVVTLPSRRWQLRNPEHRTSSKSKSTERVGKEQLQWRNLTNTILAK